MKYYFKTTGIYSNSETIRIEVEYKKGVGYNIIAEAIHVNNECGSVSKTYDKEYYQIYNDLSMNVVRCNRQSKKQLADAEQWLNSDNHAEEFAKKWIECAISRGGRKDIKIIGKEVK